MLVSVAPFQNTSTVPSDCPPASGWQTGPISRLVAGAQVWPS
jgi:hypothetical protein